MILRRFMKHVTDQNWFAVGLDVLVVIVGIFLGMQVTEWNEERKASEEEVQYLERLKVDIQQNIEGLDRIISLHLEDRDRLNEIVDEIMSPPPPEGEPDPLYTGPIPHSSVATFWVRLSSWEEMLSAGKAALLGSQTLRQKLSAFEILREEHRERGRYIELWGVEVGHPLAQFETLEKVDGEWAWRDDYRSARGDDRLARVLLGRAGNIDFLALQRNQERDALLEILAIVECELDKSCDEEAIG